MLTLDALLLCSSSFMAAASVVRLCKLCYMQHVRFSAFCFHSSEPNKDEANAETPKKIDSLVNEKQRIKSKRQPRGEWKCVHNCCWVIGFMCTVWWLMLFLCNILPPALTGFQVPELPGARLRREGLSVLHPVVMVPGIVTGGLELWEGRPCAEGLFRKRLWGGSFSEIFKRPMCVLEHLSLDNETGLDPPGIRVRAVSGLAADYFAPGYFVWAVLIKNLAKIGYEEKNMHMASYDWRLSFQNTEIRDQALSRLKSKIELMYAINGNKKVIVVPHSTGSIYFLHFMKWVETPSPMGGGGGPSWCATHIKAIVNIGPAFLGVPKAVSSIFSAEGKGVAYIRAMAPVVLESEILGLQTFEHVMRVSRSWDALISMLPKGGETIWGNLDWSPEDGHSCDLTKNKYLHSTAGDTRNSNNSNGINFFQVEETMKYGRIISFGKESSELPSPHLPGHDIKELLHRDSSTNLNSSCGEVWTEYDEVSRESIRKVAENKAYTVQTLYDLLRFVAPKMMQRAEAHFSHGVADDLDNPKYDDYKYWSNPLETKLPVAPDMEMYCLYGVGLPTERSYIYKASPSDKCKSIPFRIDTSADGESGSCLKNGAHFVDGDDTVPVLSAGYMCSKGWRGKTRFNPSGIATYVREYRHKRPGSLLEGRSKESGAHVDIMGNVALIEDVLRIAAGATGVEIGDDRIYSDLVRMSEKVSLQL